MDPRYLINPGVAAASNAGSTSSSSRQIALLERTASAIPAYGSWTTVAFNSSLYDPGSLVTLATDGSFSINATGTYLLEVSFLSLEIMRLVMLRSDFRT